MAYQFDPRPEGLHYEPFTVTFCGHTMWYLIDPAPEPWIDLRSVAKAMGMSWVRWRMYFQAMKEKWRLEACLDHSMKETLLAPGGKMPAILGDLHTHLTNNRHYSAAGMVGQLKGAWRVKYTQILEGSGCKRHLPALKVSSKQVGRGRKVTPYIVRQIHLAVQKGHRKPEIAKALKISLGVVQQVCANTYKLDAESRAAWWETFGADNGQRNDFGGSKNS